MKLYLYLFLTFSVSLLAGLSGSFSVGGAGADYNTLTEALAAVNSQGLDGDLTLTLNPGTYNGAYQLQHQSNGHRLTITGGAAPSQQIILMNSAASATNNYILKLNAVSNVTLNGLYFQQAGSYSRALHIEGNCDNLVISSNSFSGVVNAPTANSESIYFYSSGAGDADNVHIALNSFYNGSYHIITNSTSYNDKLTAWTILNNAHSNGYVGLYLMRMEDLAIESGSFGSMTKAIEINTSEGELDVSRNKIDDCQNGIVISYATVDDPTAPHVYNNIISVSNGTGLSVNGNNLNIFHNTVLNTTIESYQRYGVQVSGTRMKFKKNNVVCLGGATPLSAYSINPTDSQRNIIEHNNFYSNNIAIAQVSNDRYNQIEDFNFIAGVENSCQYPHFSGIYLTPGSPWLNNLYPSTVVTEDFTGALRNVSSSDIGAIEFSPDPALTPMSGTYMVGGGEAFTSLTAFLDAVSLRGISGNTTAYLTDALYTSSYDLNKIPGAGEAALLTIRSYNQANSIIRNLSQSSAFILKLNRVSYLKLSNLSFETTGNGTHILLNGTNSDIFVQYSELLAPASSSGYGIRSPYGSESKRIDIFSCEFDNLGTAIEVYGNGWDIYGAIFTNCGTGCFTQSSNDIRIETSQFIGSSSYAININQTNLGSILGNRISGSGNGIYFGAGAYTGGTRSLIANNAISIDGSSRNGIAISGSGINVINNSSRVYGYNGKGLYSYELGTYIDVVNNIFAVDQGLAMDFGYFSPASSKVVDYNSYYSEATGFVKMGTEYGDLASLKAAYPDYNQHSLSLLPHFTADMHTGSPWLRNAGLVRSEITTDMDGEPRGDSFDIGADQQTGPLTLSPMAGVYTVGTIGNDYSSLDTCINDIMLRGISANVTINILPGTYTGYYTIRDFPKTAPGLAISFNAMEQSDFVITPTQTYGYENFFFRLVGARNVSFNGIKMRSTQSTRQSNYIVLNGRCVNISFTNCDFDFTNANAGYSIGINTPDSQGDQLSISGCNFIGAGYGLYIAGPYYATKSYDNVSVVSCSFQGSYSALEISKTVNLSIIANQFTGVNKAMAFSYISGSSAIRRNRILTGSFTGSYSSANPISLYSCNGALESAFQIIDNIVHLTDNIVQAATGIIIGQSSHIYMAHNTISVENTTYNEYGSAMEIGNVSLSSFWNNIFCSPINGYALRINNCTDYYFSHNAYYNSAMKMASINTTTYDREEFLSLMDTNGIFANPLINALGYSQSGFLRDKAATSTIALDIDNNSFGSTPDLGAAIIADQGSPLSGNMTVGNSGSFPNLDAAIDALMKRGLGGNLVLEILPGTHNVSYTLGYVANSNLYSLKLTGTIGDAPVIQKNANSEADNFILKLMNTNNLELENLAFQSINPAFSKGLDISRYTRDLRIENCSFYTSANTQTSQYNAAIFAYEALVKDWTIVDNHIINIPYGIHIWGVNQTDILNTGLVIDQNEISGSSTSVYLGYIYAPQISHNTILGARFAGINLGSAITNLRLWANTVKTSFGTALYIAYTGTGSTDNMIYNNYFYGGTGSTVAVSINSAPNLKFYFNTIVCAGTYDYAMGIYHGSSSTGLAFVNNIVKTSLGLAAQFYQLADFEPQRWDHNLYYSAGSQKVKLGSTVINSSFNWNQSTGDQFSIFADPLLDGESYNLSAGSPARFAATIVNGIATDIEGNPRINIDLGCKEFQGTLGTPENLAMAVDSINQCVILSWDSVAGAGLYKVQYSVDPYAAVWQDAPNGNTGQTEISLPINSDVIFYRVIAIGN